MKRLGIFVFYDKDGIVDDYVIYLLDNIKDFLNDLIIVCNGALNEEGRIRLCKYTQMLCIRENKGYDAMAYKMALTEYMGWEHILKYDEVLMFNDTFFGPLYPFSDVFEKMDQADCDFWGMTFHAEAGDYIYGAGETLPAHIHTFFAAYRKSVLQNRQFQDYWNQFDASEWFFSDVAHHEQFFTQYLEELGFTWDTYVNAAEFNSPVPDNNFNHYFYIAYELIRDYHCPIIKRKNFAMKNMAAWSGNNCEDTANALRYIEKNTNYDVNMIWDNILRIHNITEIKNALHLDYVLPWEAGIHDGRSVYGKAAVMAFLQKEQNVKKYLPYLRNIPLEMDVYIILFDSGLERELKKLLPEKINIKFIYPEEKNAKADALTFWSVCREWMQKYCYVCCLHDINRESTAGPVTIRNSLFYNLWENMLKSTAYINNVINLFEENERLGFLAPPEPNHADYFGRIGAEWQDDFNNVVRFSGKLGIRGNFSRDIQCFALSNVFWCRTEALKPLIEYEFTEDEWKRRDAMEHVIEKIYPYAAQSQGYYSGIVMNSDYASLQISNLYFMLSGILGKLRTKYTITDYDSMLIADMVRFCRSRPNILIYGAGTNGIRTSNLLKKNRIAVKGFVVSDDQPQQTEKNGYPLYHLSDVPYEKDTIGMVISVAYTRDRKEILENLKHKGYEKFFSI